MEIQFCHFETFQTSENLSSICRKKNLFSKIETFCGKHPSSNCILFFYLSLKHQKSNYLKIFWENVVVHVVSSEKVRIQIVLIFLNNQFPPKRSTGDLHESHLQQISVFWGRFIIEVLRFKYLASRTTINSAKKIFDW